MVAFSASINLLIKVFLEKNVFVLVFDHDQNAYFRSSESPFSWRRAEPSRPELKRQSMLRFHLEL